MIRPWYIAVATFDPGFGQTWTSYIEGSGLIQLNEVASLDGSLCPPVIDNLNEEDWEHNVHEDGMIDFFCDLDYLLKRIADVTPVNVLAAVVNPLEECRDAFQDPRFEFKGYDLIGTGMSALSNCGGFPLAFRNDELSCVGLIATFPRGRQIQIALRENYIENHHADCDLWALWRMRKEDDTGSHVT